MKNENNIKFIDSILSENKITLNEFSKYVGIDSSFIYKYVKLGNSVSDYHIKKIFNKFNCNSIEELNKNANSIIKNMKKGIEKKESISKAKLDIKEVNISFLDGYVSTKEEVNSLARALNANLESLEYWINGYKKMPGYYLDSLLNYYNVKSIDELKEKVYDKKNNVLGSAKYVNIDILKSLLDNYNLTEEDIKIVDILFDGKNHKLDEIKKIMNVSESKILEVYKVCLKIYADSFEELYDKEFAHSLKK